ncbi:uncharacterized protein ATNIH1004_001689 [Aspergillus tanneri]|uniref:MADS-box domain-containing protein n=1 Tax=Aspergillus tanneri TaxID=1220188 RepID=A0A5M9N5C9_9EURO|nr:uncharacterized protein ATNIH1004_001689 [Aspergillus tanneri]KAA8652784.1 hypothetical protein ATNIH1004_001689 [Aspergillus tanneri]
MGTIPGVRNVSRRRETIFKKCNELSQFGVRVWVVVCSGAQCTVFKSMNCNLFESLDRQVMQVTRRPTWKNSHDYNRNMRERRPLRLIDQLQSGNGPYPHVQ